MLRCGLRLFSGGKGAAKQAAGRVGSSIQAAAGRLLLEQLTADYLAGTAGQGRQLTARTPHCWQLMPDPRRQSKCC